MCTEVRETLSSASNLVPLGLAFAWALPQDKTPLLRYMDSSYAFTRVSFANYFFDTQRANRQRRGDEFKNKIVLIGATVIQVKEF